MNQQIVGGQQQNNRLIIAAFAYLKQGLSVIPVKTKGKTPLVDWKIYTQRKPTQEEILKWFQNQPNVNVGIVTGEISGLICVDLDGQEGIEEAKRLELVSNAEVITGKGKHLYYKWQSNIQNAVRIKPGIDIRGDGGFVVAPPSIHENGKRYRWLRPLNIKELQEFPKELLKTEKLSDISKSIVGKEQGWIAKALEEMKDGNIDNTFTSILGRLRYDGWSSSDAQALLIPHAKRVGAENGHLEAKIENIWKRYEAKSVYTTERLSRSDNSLVIHSPTNPDSIKQFEQHQFIQSTVSGLSTGYSKLDSMLPGGLKSSRLFTVAARTGVGKTNWLLGCAKHLCESGKKVLLFSTEMPYTEIWQRYCATLSNPTEFENHQLFVCDSFAPNLEKVEEAINEIKPDVFMFDHINHVSEVQRELGTFMQGLNYLRRKYDVAGIVTAQLNRSADWIDLKTGEKVTPRMSMIKGSGTIEQASSRILLLSETRVLPEYTEIVGNLDKNDNGPKGLIHFGLMNTPYKMVEL
jgi:hypothetical protein